MALVEDDDVLCGCKESEFCTRRMKHFYVKKSNCSMLDCVRKCVSLLELLWNKKSIA